MAKRWLNLAVDVQVDTCDLPQNPPPTSGSVVAFSAHGSNIWPAPGRDVDRTDGRFGIRGMATKTYHESCNCGAVRFQADIDLSQGTAQRFDGGCALEPASAAILSNSFGWSIDLGPCSGNRSGRDRFVPRGLY